ncbi:MAG: N-acetyltransferase family protein [Dehalococcoidia bacterium]
MTAEFRRATQDDAAQISEVVAEVVAEPNPVGLDGPMSREEVAAWIDRQGKFGAMFVAVEEGQVLGFSAVDFDSSRAEECTIGAWIRTAARRRGLASILFEEALGFAGEQGYKRVRGRLPESNEAALSFLSTIGALVPIINPGAQYDMPIYEVRRDE